MIQHQANEPEPEELLEQLAIIHPPLNSQKREYRQDQLRTMADYYEMRLEDGDLPEHLNGAFKNYVNALAYAYTVINMYDKLTRRLRGEELSDEDRTDSQSR